jgi:hypothetical protein
LLTIILRLKAGEHIVEPVAVPFHEREALLYLGADPEDKEAAVLVDCAFLMLRNEMQPRAAAKRFSYAVVTGKFGRETGVLLSGGVTLCSSFLAHRLKGCTSLLVFAVTLGYRMDAAISRITAQNSAEGAAAEAVGKALLDAYLHKQEAIWKSKLPGSRGFLPCISPGTEDWPFNEQKKIFALLEGTEVTDLTACAEKGVFPAKSVVGVIGIY